MYDEHIQMINDWFEKHEDYGTLNNTLNYNGRIDRKCIICVLY